MDGSQENSIVTKSTKYNFHKRGKERRKKQKRVMIFAIEENSKDINAMIIEVTR